MTFTTLPAPPRPYTLTGLRWLARITSIASIGIILMFAFGEGTPTAREWVLLAFFPIGLAIGLLLGWWRELTGGVVALSSMVIFYALMFASSGKLPTGPYFAILAAPGLLFLLAGLWSRARKAD